jgi:hypothetical protein
MLLFPSQFILTKAKPYFEITKGCITCISFITFDNAIDVRDLENYILRVKSDAGSFTVSGMKAAFLNVIAGNYTYQLECNTKIPIEGKVEVTFNKWEVSGAFVNKIFITTIPYYNQTEQPK